LHRFRKSHLGLHRTWTRTVTDSLVLLVAIRRRVFERHRTETRRWQTPASPPWPLCPHRYVRLSRGVYVLRMTILFFAYELVQNCVWKRKTNRCQDDRRTRKHSTSTNS